MIGKFLDGIFQHWLQKKITQEEAHDAIHVFCADEPDPDSLEPLMLTIFDRAVKKVNEIEW